MSIYGANVGSGSVHQPLLLIDLLPEDYNLTGPRLYNSWSICVIIFGKLYELAEISSWTPTARNHNWKLYDSTLIQRQQHV